MLSLRSGDIAKITVIILTLAFLACLILHETGDLDIFSQSYQEDGFCISNKDKSPAVQSHAISFYADSATAAIMFALTIIGTRRGMSKASVAPIKKNALSLFGHGCGHLMIALSSVGESGSAMLFENFSLIQRIGAFVALFFVWYGFMRDSRRSVKVTIAFALFHNVAQMCFLPTRFFFTHVLMGVLLNSAIRGLARPTEDKDRYYDMEACLVDVPILLATFGEALTCDSFLVNYGGHVWFDMVVPVMFFVYYGILVYSPDKSIKADKDKIL